MSVFKNQGLQNSSEVSFLYDPAVLLVRERRGKRLHSGGLRFNPKMKQEKHAKDAYAV